MIIVLWICIAIAAISAINGVLLLLMWFRIVKPFWFYDKVFSP